MSSVVETRKHRLAISERFASRIGAGDSILSLGAVASGLLPCSVTDGEHRTFSGMNALVLMQVMRDKKWDDPRFFTSEQIAKNGWSLKPEAKPVKLEFLHSTDSSGFPVEVPDVKFFQVFNASLVDGVPERDTPTLASMESAVKAASAAGVGGQQSSPKKSRLLADWVESLCSETKSIKSPSGVRLRVQIAGGFLESQIESMGQDKRDGDLKLPPAELQELADEIQRDPVAFYQAVNDAARLSEKIMVQVRLNEMEAAMGDSLAAPLSATDIDMGKQAPQRASDRIEALFTQRQAMLAVPYTERHEASARGAIYYPPQKVWFVPPGVPMDPFSQWNVATNCLSQVATASVFIDSFKDAMSSMGFDTSKGVKADGKWHSVSVDSTPVKNKSGSYILSLECGGNGLPTGMLINRHSGESQPWRYEGELLTPEQRAQLRVQALEREAQALKNTSTQQNVAAGHAKEIWARGDPAGQHGYIVKKGIPSEGARQVRGSVLLEYTEYIGESGASIIQAEADYLIVPMRSTSGELRALQAISEDGAVKTFMRGAQKQGTMLVFGAESFDAIKANNSVSALAYVEGFATGASLRSGAGESVAVVVCFDAGNMEAVVKATAKSLPEKLTTLVAVDNDQFHVEKALGYLSSKLGLSPHVGDASLPVLCGKNTVRHVRSGEAMIDGEWHECAKGSYRVMVTKEPDADAIRALSVEVVPSDGGRKIACTFNNRGVEAGIVAMQALTAADRGGRATLVIPEFKSLAGRPTDWNDLHMREGTGMVRAALEQVEGLALPIPRLSHQQRLVARPSRRSIQL